MNHEMNLLTIANEIMAAQDQCKLIVPLTSRFADFNNGEAYAVAQLVHEMRIKEGAVSVSRKIGFTNPKMRSIYGVCEPIWGHIYDNTVIQMADAASDISPNQRLSRKSLYILGPRLR